MKRDVALWMTVLAGPILWLCAFQASFALAPYACIFQSKLALASVWLCGILLSLLSALWAWRLWHHTGANYEIQDHGVIPRSRAMSIAGMTLSFGFAVIMLAQLIPVMVLGSCE
jgi:hypothetical protein